MATLTFAVVCLLWFACPPDPAAGPLVLALGSPSYRTREAATASLQQMGRKAVGALQDASANHSDAEVRSRCQRLLARLWEPASVWPEPFPWIDQLGAYRKYIWQDYLHQAQREWCLQEPLGWPTWRRATLYMVRDWMELGAPAWWIVATLREMQAEEAEYRVKHGMAGGL